ncbi:MAG: serine/threonine-protein phosphatase [Lentisphaeria bacterium]|nr:serine/threonine-protein phosphatase [Lentisphaeria bacterium]
MNQTEQFNWMETVFFSDPGLVRRENEDSCAVIGEEGCYLVSDGMGGGSDGEIASQIVVETISDSIADTASDSPGSRKYAVQQAVHRANRMIREYSQAHNYAQMGATLVLLLLDTWHPGKALLCHVGDSRIYRFRNGTLQQLTRDHTVGAELALSLAQKGSKQDGAIMMDHTNSPFSHVLTRSIGVSENVLPEWDETTIEPGDLLMLCSDGVTTMLKDEEIQQIFLENASTEGKMSTLSKRVLSAGARDNFTMILCQSASSLPSPKTPTEEEIQENRYLLKIAEERKDNA